MAVETLKRVFSLEVCQSVATDHDPLPLKNHRDSLALDQPEPRSPATTLEKKRDWVPYVSCCAGTMFQGNPTGNIISLPS
jgi:hypothetical protein